MVFKIDLTKICYKTTPKINYFFQAQKILEKINKELRQLEKIIAELNEKYATAIKEKDRLQREMEFMLLQLELANKLLYGLSSENERYYNDS